MNYRKKVSREIITVIVMATMVSTAAMSTSKASEINRIAGADRYKTSVELSKKVYTKADKAIIANGENFADALCAGVISGKAKSPLLLSKPENISDEAVNELKRLGVKEILIAGGENSVSKSVEEKLAKDYKINRIAGADRYKTSVELAKYIKDNFGLESIGIANGEKFADALAATPYMNAKNGAIILSNGTDLDKDAEALIENKPITVFGGENSVSAKVADRYKAKRIAGADRYETAMNIAKEIDPSNSRFVVVNGNIFSDALSSSALAMSMGAPIVFDSSSTINKISSNPSAKVIVVGGENSVSNDTLKKIEKGDKEKVETNSTSSGSSRRHHSSSSSAPKREVVEFGDENVKREVVNLLANPKKLYDGSKALTKEQKKNYQPTKEDMKNIKILDVSFLMDDKFEIVPAKSLKGIEEAVNAEEVKLDGLDWKDFGFLKNFKKMKSLSLISNGIENIDFLKEYPELEKLDLSRNKITSLEPIKGMIKLKQLIADTNKLTEINVVKNMPELENLTVYENKISDISPVEKLENLKYLQLAGNEIRSIDKIGKKPLLEELYFTGEYTKPFDEPEMVGNFFKDITPLATMTNLKVLYLQDVRLIEDISPLQNLTKLETLSIRNNRVTNVEPLKNLTKLKMLHLYKNRIEDISSLENLKEMEEFNFAVNKVKDMSVIEKLPSVSFLMAYANELTDLSPINKAESLMVVNAHKNHISDFSPLGQFFKEKPGSSAVLDSQTVNETVKAEKVEEADGAVKITVKNPLKDIKGASFNDIANSGILEGDGDTSNEMNDFYKMYNKALEKLKNDGIKVETEDDNIVITMPKDKYEGVENTIGLPFYRSEVIPEESDENSEQPKLDDEKMESYSTIGGVLYVTIENNK